MEHLEKHIWNEKAKAPDEAARRRVLKNWDAIAKPIDGMGRFETMTAQIGAITGTDRIDISKKAVVIMCADNGIVEENISQSGQDVTIAVARAMGMRQSSVCKMAKAAGADIIPVDIGINSVEPIQGVLDRKVRNGTNNFRKEPAMTEEEAIRAIAVGIDTVNECREKGYRILATGEMGIGNTTTSSAVTAALIGGGVGEVTGRGAGLDDAGLERKKRIITEAIEKYDLKHEKPLRVLATVGGLDIAGIAGICIGGALFHIPVVLDGVISMAAALLAERMMSGTKDYLLASHKGKEPAMAKLIGELGLDPVIDAGLALGEGTGAVMLFSLLDMALEIYNGGMTFHDMKIEQYDRIVKT